MSVFLDTSALLAMLDASDSRHENAERSWRSLLAANDVLLSSNYVLVETISLAQRRLGLEAVRSLERDVFPLLEIEWIDEDVHRSATSAVLAASRRAVSLVDCSSFEVMRRRGVARAFAFDRHFVEQGFELIS